MWVKKKKKKVTKLNQPPYMLCNEDKAQVLIHRPKAGQKLGFNGRLCDDANSLMPAN